MTSEKSSNQTRLENLDVFEDPVIVVSGLPRSGTSLMMQILESVGIPILTDQVRSADDSNPRGYYEFEPVKRLMLDQSWVSSARGKGVKIVLQLLPYLPPKVPLAVILMDRSISEVVTSQNAMLERLGKTPQGESSVLESVFRKQRESVLEYLKHRPLTRWIEISHKELVTGNRTELEKIIDFLEIDPQFEGVMLARIEPSLHRTK